MAPLRSLTVLGLIAFGLMTSPASAGDLDFQFNGDDYKIVVTGATWAAASGAAEQIVVNGIRGHLCIIDSTQENAAIFNAMTTAGVDTVASQGGGAIYGWLGGSDDPASIPEASEGEFFWVDGSQFWTGGMTGSPVCGSYVNFGRPQEPDDFPAPPEPGQEHLAMALEAWPFGGPGQWNDINSESLNNQLGFCIEHNAAIFADGFELSSTCAWTEISP